MMSSENQIDIVESKKSNEAEMSARQSFADDVPATGAAPVRDSNESVRDIHETTLPLLYLDNDNDSNGQGKLDNNSRPVDPMDKFIQQMQAEKAKERDANINSIADSVAKNGKFPADIQNMLRDFEPMMYAGFHGDFVGMTKFVAEINKKLKETGSQYHLDIDSREKNHSKDSFSPYSSIQVHTISVKNSAGEVQDKVKIHTDPVALPDVKF